jgi:uncharacterized membrane protein
MILLLAMLACGAEEEALDPLCEEAPVVTWDYWGEGFLAESCQSCHASTSVDRRGAPEGVSFDTEPQVRAQAEAILAVATGEEPSMPPGGGVSEDDRYLLEIWLSCWIGEE